MKEKKLIFRKSVFSSLPFYFLALILGATFFLGFMSSFKYYRTQISVLFIPRSENITKNSAVIMKNLVRLPGTLAFYEQMLAENQMLKDAFSGLDNDAKKRMWNRTMQAEIDDGSSMIKFEVFSKNRMQSVLFAKQTSRTLFNTASFYYDIKKDVDFRVVEKPITQAVIRNWQWLAVSSLFFGLALSYFLNAMYLKLAAGATGKKVIFEKSVEFKKSYSPAQNKLMPPRQKEEVKQAEAWTKKAQAPDNLPIAFGERNTENRINVAKENKKPFAEPTEEELKKRLNKLLRGEM